ncbi:MULTISPECIES: peptidoglycan-binding protein [Olivibacter]|uniref:Peptidoglycan-binding protein n=1 Tax=Olivibacter jilunii TaxID=985016 RepID=A0ABW6AW83_9SPHI
MDIPKIKKRLNELGYGPLSESGPNAQYYGPSTTAAVIAFQTDHGLETDGEVGPETITALFPNEKLVQDTDPYQIKAYPIIDNSLRMHAMHIMLSQVGLKEKGNNGGPAVNAFLKSVGLGTGYAWCMAFVYWCFNEASKDLQKFNPLIKTGHVLTQWNKVDKSFKILSDPEPGDIFIMDFGNGSGHTGMITGTSDNVTVTTVEGNTNREGSRNGDGVYVRTRKMNSIKGYIRIPG